MKINILTRKNKKCTGSLCFYCKRCASDCEWMRNLTPVRGWTALATDILVSVKKELPSYHVYDCPNFVNPSYKK